jgi:hypothetical protein
VDVNLHRVAFNLFAPSVEALFDLGTGQDVAGPLHQQLQERKLLRREPDFPTLAGDLVGGWIQSYAQVLDFRLRAPGLAAQERPDSRGELIEVERLYQVVVRARVESLDPVGYGIASRDDEDRETLLPRSESL